MRQPVKTIVDESVTQAFGRGLSEIRVDS